VFTTVAVLRDPWEAHLLRGRLEAERIPAIIVHECHIAVCWDFSFALGGVKVQVPEEQQEAARDVERQCRAGAFKELLAAKFGDLDDVSCPYCGCRDYRKRRPYPRAALAIVFSWLAGGVWPPKGWVYGCNNCGARYSHQLDPHTWTYWPKMAAVSVALALLLFGTFGVLWLIVTTKLGLVAVTAALIVVARWVSRTITEHDSEIPD